MQRVELTESLQKDMVTNMIIEPAIRQNMAIYAHPMGCRQNVLEQIEEIKDKEKITNKKLNVLIIGGSSGYGLASRIALAFNAGAYTCNVSFERAPKGRMTGSAGYFNNYYFNQFAKEATLEADDLDGDCFSHDMKKDVVSLLQGKGKKIDLIVYSVASGVRTDPDTGEKYTSALKPVGSAYRGLSVDLSTDTLDEKVIEPANEDELHHTVKIMGGEDYLLWVKALESASLLNGGAKTVAYTYIGTPFTYDIYKNGTIGHAKRHLEETNIAIQKILDNYKGKAIICSSKTVVTKASVFIPSVAIYASALFKIMKEKGTHESITMHKYRLFKDFIYGGKPVVDDSGIYRLDAFEMQDDTQMAVGELMQKAIGDDFGKIVDFSYFKHEFLAINGFDLAGVDYNEDIDLTTYTS